MNGGSSGGAAEALESRREAARRELASGATNGLTLGEYAERATAIEQAATAGELEALREPPLEGATARPTRKFGRWIIAVLGGARQEGRWRLDRRLWIVAVLGGAKLDLGEAQPVAPETDISVFAALGGVDLLAPPGVSVQLSGLSLLGGKADTRAGGPPLPGCPLVRVHAFTFMGGVAIKESPRGAAGGDQATT